MPGSTTATEPEGNNEPVSFWREYSLLIGLGLLVIILVILLTPIDVLTDVPIKFIDSELGSASENATPVLTKMDLSSSEQLRQLPTEFGDWSGSDYEISTIETALEADCMLMRSYSKPGLYQPIFLLIMQSELTSSFHPPVVCYPALGYEIEEEGKEQVQLADTSWAGFTLENTGKLPQRVREELKATPYAGWLSVKKLVVFKQNDGKVTERRVVLYLYMKDNYMKDNILISNRVTMIRVSALAPLTGSHDEIVNIEKEFISDIFPYIFEIRQGNQGPLIIVHLARSGVDGCLLIAFLFSVPLAILIYPYVRHTWLWK